GLARGQCFERLHDLLAERALAGLVAELPRDLGARREDADLAWPVDKCERLVGPRRGLRELAGPEIDPAQAGGGIVLGREIRRGLLERGYQVERPLQIVVDLGARPVVG